MNETLQIAIVSVVAGGALLTLVRPLLPRRRRTGASRPAASPGCEKCGAATDVHTPSSPTNPR